MSEELSRVSFRKLSDRAEQLLKPPSSDAREETFTLIKLTQRGNLRDMSKTKLIIIINGEKLFVNYL